MTSPTEIVDAARRIATATPYGFLTTAADHIQTRLVQHLEVTDNCQITFSTGRGTRKAASLRLNPSVSYAVYAPDKLAAATVYGTAFFDERSDRQQQLWTDELSPFFVDGPDGDGFVLVTIAPTRIEVWSVPDGLAPPPFGLSSMMTELSGDTWTGGTGTHPAA